MGQLLTYEQAGQRLGLRAATVRKLAADGYLPKIRPTPAGRAVRIPLEAVEAVIRHGLHRRDDGGTSPERAA